MTQSRTIAHYECYTLSSLLDWRAPREGVSRNQSGAK